MLIVPKYSQKSLSKNKIYLITGIGQIPKLQLSKKQKTYISTELANKDYVELNSSGDGGGFIIVCKLEKLSEPKNKEAVRKFGFQVYTSLKDKCIDIQIESSSAEAIELFSEGLALSS